tara:strand:+ start:425 stop:1468 length:1044 start_codon:yes stop_codon:yes gene_type:complete
MCNSLSSSCEDTTERKPKMDLLTTAAYLLETDKPSGFLKQEKVSYDPIIKSEMQDVKMDFVKPEKWDQSVVEAAVKPASRKHFMPKGGTVCDEKHGFSHTTHSLFHAPLSIFSAEKTKYLVGVQVARLLKRKTFNMYRCMKKKQIPIRRATPSEVEFLCSVKAVRSGTHSVTLVPYADALYFIADALYRNVRFPNEGQSSKRQSYVNTKPKIHRRKPMPWDVQRSVKKGKEEGDSPVPLEEKTLFNEASSSCPRSYLASSRPWGKVGAEGKESSYSYSSCTAGNNAALESGRMELDNLMLPTNNSDRTCFDDMYPSKALSYSSEGRTPGPVCTPTRAPGPSLSASDC